MNDETSPRIGLIGVGLLGSAMASRWLAAHRTLLAYDIDPARMALAVQHGARMAPSLRDVALHADPLVLSLPDSHVVAEVIAQVEADLRPGQTVIDTTTGSPTATLDMAGRMAARGVDWLDATIAGSSHQVERGEATVLVGGERASFQRHQAIFDPLSTRVFWLGPSGSGARMKLVVNLAIGLHRAVLAESLALAGAMGLDLAQTLEVLKASPAYSRAMDIKGAKMIAGDFAPQARLKQHLKDVHLILAAGQSHGQPLPLSELHQTILQTAVEQGDGDLDNSAVIRRWLRD